MRTDDLLLATGLTLIALGASLFPFPMIGLIGGGLLVIALGILITAVILARPTSNQLPLWKQVTGGLLSSVGVFVLLGAAGYIAGLGYDQVMSSRRPALSPPSATHWILMGTVSLLPALMIGVGLRMRAGWAWKRVALWSALGWGVIPLTLFLFFVFTRFWPITA